MENITGKYYDIMLVGEESPKDAVVLLYGYIGESYDYDIETNSWKMDGIVDIDFVSELKRLATQYERIHIRINSPGGDVFHGLPIMTAIRNCKAEVHTYCDGIAASMAAGIWLCGHKRHMATNGLLMLHACSSICWGNSEDMRDCATALDKMNNAIIIGAAASTGLSEEEIRSAYFSDYRDHWLNYNDAVAAGLVSEKDDEYEAAGLEFDNIDDDDDETPGAAPAYDPAEDAEKKKERKRYMQLLHKFTRDERRSARAAAAPARLRAAALAAAQSITKPSSNDMTFEEFKQALADGTLSADSVRAALDEQDQEPAQTNQAGAEPSEVESAIALLTEQVKALTAAVGAKPGTTKSAPGLPDSDPATYTATGTAAEQRLKDYNERIAKAYSAGDDVRVTSFRTLE